MPIGINPVQQPRQEIKEKEETDVDKLFKYLQIANTGMGIAVNFDKIRYGGERAQAEIDYKKSQQSYMEKQTAGLPSKEESQQLRSAAKAKTQLDAKRTLTDRESSVRKTFDSDPITQKIQGSYSNASRTLGLLAGDHNKINPLNLEAAKRTTLKAIEDGKLSDADVLAYNPNPAFTAEIGRSYKTLVEGGTLGDDVLAYRRLASVMQLKAKDQLLNHAASQADSPSAREFGNPEYVMKNIFNIEGKLQEAPMQEKDTAFSPIGFDRTDSKEDVAPVDPAQQKAIIDYSKSKGKELTPENAAILIRKIQARELNKAGQN